MRALVIGEVNASGMKPTSASLVSAALKAAGSVDLLLLGQAPKAQEAAKVLSGVEKVFVNPDSGENILTESLSKAVVALVKEQGYRLSLMSLNSKDPKKKSANKSVWRFLVKELRLSLKQF